MPDVAEHAQVLADAVDQALPRWVVACVERIHTAWAGATPAVVRHDAASAGQAARDEIGGRVRSLLETDIDAQRSTPLTELRAAVRYPTEVLARAGVPPVARDAFAAEAFPADRYDLTPAALADIDQSLHEPGLAWGAAKAWAHRQRHGRSSE